MTADIFFRLHHPSLARVLSPQNVRSMRLCFPEGTDIATIVRAALAAGAPIGSSRSGIFEVQTDDGIYAREDGGKLNVDTERKVAKIKFQTWDSLEAEEAA